jgi:DNA-directed RNA polymerase, mitochondrial
MTTTTEAAQSAVTMDPLYEEEVRVEAEAVGLGQVRYEKLRSKAEDKTRPGKDFLRTVIPHGAAAIEAWQKDALDGKPGPQAGMGKYISQFDPVDLSFLVCRVVLLARTDSSATSLSMDIASTMERMLETDALKKTDPKGFKRLQHKIDKCPFPDKRYVLVRKGLEKAQVTSIKWGPKIQGRIGRLLLELVSEATGAFTIKLTRLRKKTYDIVYMSESMRESINARHEQWSIQSPMFLPMVIKPRRWVSPLGGGYLDRKALRRKLITSRRLNNNYMEELKNTSMPTVYAAINAMQETEWVINRQVYTVAKTLWEKKMWVAGLPAADPKPLPPQLSDEEWALLGKKEQQIESAKRYEVHNFNREAIGKRIKFTQQMWIAERFERYDAIYFPHVMDWRGRCYPVPTLLNPQENDIGRALLTFAKGAPLGDHGLNWLMIHGANTYGIDKVPFAEREAWVEARQDEIYAVAQDPLANLSSWVDADKPFLFLAFAFEWARLMDHVRDGGEVEDFVSTLPVSWDGSCNGLQNFSAMLRDPIGGKYTNLVPSDRPSDIYAQVAEVASRIVGEDAANGEVNANYWLGKIDRKMAKRPTMTLPYGSGRFGFKDQILIELKDRKNSKEGVPYILGNEFFCAKYLAGVMDKALAKVVVKAREAMGWLKQVSIIAAQDGLPVQWTSPVGFPVMQEYRTTESSIATITVGGRTIQFSLLFTGDKLDSRKQAQGIAPNFVHSLDAAHLQRTVVRAHELGIRSFAMVHDSYGTTAGNAQVLQEILRETFVEQYSGNVLEDFANQLRVNLPAELAAKIPPLPVPGDLDLEGVKSSLYFFA